MTRKGVPVIAIDGPSASGKGTIAQLVAQRLGFHYLDSGALYRLVGLAARRAQVNTSDEMRVARLAKDLDGCKSWVQDSQKSLQQLGVNSTPSFFINGKHFGGGAAPKEEFKKIIDERLKVAEASGVSGAEYYEKEIMGKGEKQFRSKVDPKPN